jgi:hypothetical protein
LLPLLLPLPQLLPPSLPLPLPMPPPLRPPLHTLPLPLTLLFEQTLEHPIITANFDGIWKSRKKLVYLDASLLE